METTHPSARARLLCALLEDFLRLAAVAAALEAHPSIEGCIGACAVLEDVREAFPGADEDDTDEKEAGR